MKAQAFSPGFSSFSTPGILEQHFWWFLKNYLILKVKFSRCKSFFRLRYGRFALRCFNYEMFINQESSIRFSNLAHFPVSALKMFAPKNYSYLFLKGLGYNKPLQLFVEKRKFFIIKRHKSLNSQFTFSL